MRVLVVRPGPAFSVADVHRGWVRGLAANGCVVADVNFDDRLEFYETAHVDRDGRMVKALPREGAIALANKSLQGVCYEFAPDVVVVVSGFFVLDRTLELMRARGTKVVLLHTESPYEDDRQLARAGAVHLNLLNDPTNLERFRAVAPTVYVPHAYDPDVHHPRPARAELASDFCFVGTGYPSRIAFLDAVDFSGIDVALAGNWQALAHDSPLRPFVVHPIEHCCDNDEATELYASAKASANLYRREAERPELSAGWAMGPREVELAACGTFFLRDPRGESDEILSMLPSFEGPGDFAEQLRWWLAHDEDRAAAADAARLAVADRTFTANAAALLRLLERI